jgi:hypothetical protein
VTKKHEAELCVYSNIASGEANALQGKSGLNEPSWTSSTRINPTHILPPSPPRPGPTLRHKPHLLLHPRPPSPESRKDRVQSSESDRKTRIVSSHPNRHSGRTGSCSFRPSKLGSHHLAPSPLSPTLQQSRSDHPRLVSTVSKTRNRSELRGYELSQETATVMHTSPDPNDQGNSPSYRRLTAQGPKGVEPGPSRAPGVREEQPDIRDG